MLRVRKVGDTAKLTYKEYVSNQLDCIEEGLAIADADTMRRIIERLGFIEVIQVHKKRITIKYKDYEICFDIVDDLGAFIEVEKIVPDDEGDGVQDELYEFLSELGFTKEDRVTIGYDVLMFILKHQS